MESNSGVYVIKNNVNQKCYVGSTKNLKQRLTKHKSMLIDGNHHNINLQEDYNKYGASAFTFEVLLECSESEARKQEARFIQIFNCEKDGYNAKPDKENIKKRIVHDEEQITSLLSQVETIRRDVTYVFDFFYVSQKLKKKPSAMLHFCGIDKGKTWPAYTKCGQYVIGCDSIDGDLCFLVCFIDTEWNGDFVYV